MRTLTQNALESALKNGQTIETPVQIKTDWVLNTKHGRVTVLSTILEYDEYVDSLVYKDTCFLYKGRLNLLNAMIPVAESLETAITNKISRTEAYYNRSIAARA